MNHIIQFLDLPFQVEKDFCIFKDKDTSCFYNEFMKKVVAVALSIAKQNKKKQGIAVFASHNVETIIYFIGILLSGNYYVPISDEAPEELVNKIRQQADFTEDIEITYQENQVTSKDYDMLIAQLESASIDDIMYMVFTSGSTGVPKKVAKTHRNMISFLQAYTKGLKFNQEHILGNQTPFYFDASAKDIYTTLYCKCKMVILDSRLFVNPIRLVSFLNEEKINRIQWVPSALSIVSMLHTFEQVKPLYLQQVCFVGEVFPIPQLLYWMKELPETEFINLYGASEMAGICAYAVLEYDEIVVTKQIPIGMPLQNSEIILVDQENNQIHAPNMPGEIYVSSEAIAPDYITKDENMTKGYYHTGDLAIWDEKGRLQFVGREDDQIKHMGHRIELGEIETAAREIQDVEDACCIFAKNKIILFIQGQLDKAVVTKALKAKIADYMLPSKILLVDEIPKNKNGKKDKIRLKEMLEERKKVWKK